MAYVEDERQLGTYINDMLHHTIIPEEIKIKITIKHDIALIKL